MMSEKEMPVFAPAQSCLADSRIELGETASECKECLFMLLGILSVNEAKSPLTH
jgi:hypothetical protein